MLSRFSCVQLFATQWIITHQASLSMGFSRQEYWSGLPCLPPGNLSNPGIKPMSPADPVLQADSLPLSHQGSPKGPWLGIKFQQSLQKCHAVLSALPKRSAVQGLWSRPHTPTAHVPGMHRHVKPPILSKQVASFLQGSEWHSLMSISQRGPA